MMSTGCRARRDGIRSRTSAALACLLGLTGCDQLFGLDRLEPVYDASADATGCGGRLVHVCPTLVPSAFELSDDTTLDTTDAPCELVDQGNGQPTLCVIAAEVIHIGNADVHVTGPHPVVLFATETFTLDAGGTLDASSTATVTGAGANWGPTVPDGANQSNAMPGGAGGGAGGSFGGRGGDGGASDTGERSLTLGAIMPAELAFVRGGMSGAGGGGAIGTPTIHAAGGSSGGAIYVIAGTSISIAGHVLANGAGGEGGRGQSTTLQHAAGGGGGSGGLVALDAPIIELATTAVILAEGGGGGGGASGTSSGTSGQPPDSASPDRPAAGGGGAGGAGAGGTASGGAITNGSDGGMYDKTAGGGAGGGGGGAGVCLLFGARQGQGSVNPPPFAVP